MTKYIFNVTSFSTLSKNKPKQIIILCHGYGGGGQDISVLANSWRRFLPDAVLLCPNAPEVCTVNPLGYQWFDMAIENDETILEKSLVAEKKLNTFLDQVLDNFQLDTKNLALVGFSQGCMMMIQTALKKKEQINCLVGYSGKLVIVNFWATWCKPCKEEMLTLDSLSQDKNFENLIIFPVNIENINYEKTKEFFSNLNIKKLEIFFDPNLIFVKELKLRGVPTTVIINKKGEEFARIIGSIDFKDKKFLKWLSSYD